MHALLSTMFLIFLPGELAMLTISQFTKTCEPTHVGLL